MIYVLDTNICIHAMQGRQPALAARMDACEPWEIAMSMITLAELEYGVLRLPFEEQFRARSLLDMLKRRMTVLNFDAEAARAYASVRRADPARNRNALDKLIAAQALAAGAVLVTANEADFIRVPNLRVENWAV